MHPRASARSMKLCTETKRTATLRKRFGASESAVHRHRQEHLSKTSAKAAKHAIEVAQADSLLEKIEQPEVEARQLGRRAGDVLHHEIRSALWRRSGVQHFRDRRMVHQRERLALRFESRDHFAALHAGL